jgi:hypothetical protein
VRPKSGCLVAKQITLKASLKWPDVEDDYVVRYEDHVIGRIRLSGGSEPGGKLWEWSITIPMAIPQWASGSAANRDAGMKDLAVAWGRLLNETSPERLNRAWELERAVEAREQKRPG